MGLLTSWKIVVSSIILLRTCSAFISKCNKEQRIQYLVSNAREDEVGETRAGLLANPIVEVRPSTIEGAGDGVFTKRAVSQGETLTWVDFVYESVEELSKGMNVYHNNYFDWHKKKAAYELADGTQRSPKTGGVGHIINDGARIRALQWSLDSQDSSLLLLNDDCTSYSKKSEGLQNVALMQVPGSEIIDFGQGEMRSRMQIVKAIKDIDSGEELLRSYGQAYWLDPAEYELLYLMDFARVDFRLATKLLSEQQTSFDSTFFANRAQSLYDSANARLESLSANTDTNWSQRHPYRTFDGYEAWLWMHLPPPQLRVDLANHLQLYSDTVLFGIHDESSFPAGFAILRDVLRELHTLDGQTFGNLVRKYLDPPYTPDHDARCQSGLQAGGRSLTRLVRILPSLGNFL